MNNETPIVQGSTCSGGLLRGGSLTMNVRIFDSSNKVLTLAAGRKTQSNPFLKT
jgi:hypothetical protein